MLPLEHLSASSISLFLRCPRQWQEVYIRGIRGSSSSSLVIGSAVHLGLSRLLLGQEVGNFFEESMQSALQENEEVIWKDKPEAAKKWAEKMLWNYYEKVGKFLDVVSTEQEILVEIPGVDIPLLGYVDIETSRGIIDVKTTGYVSRKPELNPEWKLQMNIYQIKYPQPGEFHVVTRNSTNPVVVPDSIAHPFYVGTPSKDFLAFVAKIYKEMVFNYEQYGDKEDWRGNVTHPWAGKYCPLGAECCQR